ncbi:Wax ester synthase-like Acyl-CoA acyltransferase domain [Prauserella sp. Am3]|nr:Wax ester synthase-like Acyl-CoA acyltransferase domain [Prauserella sp. Am3]
MRAVFRPTMNPAEMSYLAVDRRHEVNVSMVFLLHLDHTPSTDDVRAALARLAETVPRFRQRIVHASPWRINWSAATPTPVERHLTELPGDSADLHTVLGRLTTLLQRPFDPARPPWQAYHVRHTAGGRSLLVLRLHHSMGDGETYVAALQQAFADTGPGLVAVEHPRSPSDLLSRVRGTLGAAGRTLAALCTATGRSALRAEVDIWTTPPPPGRVGRSRRGQRIAVWTAPLQVWRDAAHALGGRHNSLFLLIAAHAEADYHGWPDTDSVTIMPVSTRSSDPHAVQDGAISLVTGVLVLDRDAVRSGHLAPVEHAAQEARRRATTGGTHPPVADDLMRLLPESLRAALHVRLFARSDVVASNVGRGQRMRVGGAEVTTCAVVSPAVACPIAFTTFTYDDEVSLVASIDPGMVARPDDVEAAITAALRRFVPGTARR